MWLHFFWRTVMKGLYIHIPFCVKKCEYCDFLSFSGCENYFDEYISALLREMEKHQGTEFDTVFIGGGTPSVLSYKQIERVCDGIKHSFKLSPNLEWTMEINPGTITEEKIQAMKDGGVNRVSVGVQSFNDNELEAVGRIHRSKSAYDTVTVLHNAGFSNISIDLMESLPYQTDDSFKHSLEVAMSLPISHISVYSLIIEDGTPIKEKYDNGIYALPDEDSDRDLYKYTGEYLKQNGFSRYEISNYAKAGFESKHNLKYWNCDEYIGIGLGAHSYIDGVRSYNTSVLGEYISGVTTVDENILTKDDKMGEFMMLGLRKTEGIDKNEFYRRFDVYPDEIWKSQLDKFIALKLMKEKNGAYSLTQRGIDISNSIMCEFL